MDRCSILGLWWWTTGRELREVMNVWWTVVGSPGLLDELACGDTQEKHLWNFILTF